MPDCSPCNTSVPAPPCQDCDAVLQSIKYCDDGCADTIKSDCVLFGGNTISTGSGDTIYNLENLTSVIQKLTLNNLDVTIGATFNNISRVLTITKNGTTAASVGIPDSDDQYLLLVDGKLQIWKHRAGATDLKVNEVDISTSFPETTFAATSDSLLITPGGVDGHSPAIELVPSSDTGNYLIQGSDGRPFVPAPPASVNDVIITSIQGLSFTKVVTNSTLTFTPVIDWQYFASQICPLCSPACGVPSNLIAQTV